MGFLVSWVTEEDQSLKPLVGSFALWTVPAVVLRARSGSGMRREEEQRGREEGQKAVTVRPSSETTA